MLWQSPRAGAACVLWDSSRAGSVSACQHGLHTDISSGRPRSPPLPAMSKGATATSSFAVAPRLRVARSEESRRNTSLTAPR